MLGFSALVRSVAIGSSSAGLRARQLRLQVAGELNVAHRHVEPVGKDAVDRLHPAAELRDRRAGRGEHHRGGRDIDDGARQGPLRHLHDTQGMREHDLESSGSGGAEEPPLEVQRRSVGHQPAALGVHEEGIADVFERHLLAVAERLGRRPPAVTLALPGPEQERERLAVWVQRWVSHRPVGARRRGDG